MDFTRRLTGGLGLALLLGSSPAGAWDFPEHAELTRISLDHHLPETARAVVARAVQEVATETGLCRELSIPLAELDVKKSRCVPFSVLPALAGDHSVDVKTLFEALTQPEPGRRRPLAQRVTAAVSPLFADYLASASHDVVRLYRSDASSEAVHSDGGSHEDQRAFMRRVDILLEATDPYYSSRAGGSRAHFQDATRPMDSLLGAATASGDLGNALAQTMAHHARSLEFALVAPQSGVSRAPMIAEALLEHALAVHFLQDAFAAGHIGTEPALVDSVSRLRRHDFLNRVGLSVTRTFSTQACHSPRESFTRTDGCWIAYGDGYLDWNNARIVANATARLTVELAIALDRAVTREALHECTDAARENAPPVDFGSGRIESTSPDGNPRVDIHSFDVTSGKHVSVKVLSPDFEPHLRVHRKGEAVWRTGDAKVLEGFSSVEIPNAAEGEYELAVSTSDRERSGEYLFEVTATDEDSLARNCDKVLALYELLDPTPPWSMSEGTQQVRRSWTREQREQAATFVVEGVQSAMRKLAARAQDDINDKKPLLAPASADRSSSAKPGALTSAVLGAPLDECERRPHGRAFCLLRLGDVDVSLWRPILVVWPGPTADVRIGEGEDSFGYGMASQVIYGGGGAVGVSHHAVPWAIGPFFGAGFAFRVDSLFPTRTNRELVGVDVGLAPVFTAGLTTRYAALLFVEVRAPIWATLGALAWGKEAALGPIELGPTGVRFYWEAPQHLPDHGGQLIGWDLEVLNIRLGGIQATRTASLGSKMDWELRFRLGHMNLAGLDSPQPEAVWTLGAEVSGGYSVFLFH